MIKLLHFIEGKKKICQRNRHPTSVTGCSDFQRSASGLEKPVSLVVLWCTEVFKNPDGIIFNIVNYTDTPRALDCFGSV